MIFLQTNGCKDSVGRCLGAAVRESDDGNVEVSFFAMLNVVLIFISHNGGRQAPALQGTECICCDNIHIATENAQNTVQIWYVAHCNFLQNMI